MIASAKAPAAQDSAGTSKARGASFPHPGKPIVGVALGCLFLAACSANPATKTAKLDPKLGVAASEQVAEEGDDIAKGGGRRHVGKPYQIAGRTYVPKADPTGYSAEGLASWYGPGFHGRKTSNGEVFDRSSITAAHPTLPLPSYVRVTNQNNGRSMVVRVNDRGPFHRGRVIDVSQRAADALGFRNRGVAKVAVEYVGPASLEGSDDAKLMASLTIDGTPARMDGGTMLASAEPPARLGTVEGRASAPSMAMAMASAPVNNPRPRAPAAQAVEAVSSDTLNEMDQAALAALSGGESQGAQSGGTTPADASSRVQAGFAALPQPSPLRPSIAVADNNGQMVAPKLGAMALSGFR